MEKLEMPEEFVSKNKVLHMLRNDLPLANFSGRSVEKALKNLRVICEEIEKLPPDTVDPMKHGHWMKNKRGDYCVVCSNCLFGLPANADAWTDCNRLSDERETCWRLKDLADFCPNCGARMDGITERG